MVIGNKHIPDVFKFNSRKNRLILLRWDLLTVMASLGEQRI